ncbi:formin-J-like isoform X2 [Gigantopelta aegis]|uniref:formin-J-like isoform X2 n=1 Tax=Gigantopelta aegis TaxID=1735272 RepID=UPI001B887546|nr:formin-J-like isoform X2 [Gigantopelta aegis]
MRQIAKQIERLPTAAYCRYLAVVAVILKQTRTNLQSMKSEKQPSCTLETDFVNHWQKEKISKPCLVHTVPASSPHMQFVSLLREMDCRRPQKAKKRNVFKGSVLVDTLLEQNHRRFRSRFSAIKFAKRLFREGVIKSIFGTRSFEDSAQLYMWEDDDIVLRRRHMMTSSVPVYQTCSIQRQHLGTPANLEGDFRAERQDIKIIDDVKNKIINRSDNLNIVSSFNKFFQVVEKDFPERPTPPIHQVAYRQAYPWDSKRESTCSTDSSIDTRTRDKNPRYMNNVIMGSTRGHMPIPEERLDVLSERADAGSVDYDVTSQTVPGTLTSHASSAGTMESEGSQRRWAEPSYSYSDNEKQLIEEMKKMRKEHQNILRTYEERINKLMAKMHELRSIAEMLENSSTKSSPYAVLPAKASLLNIIGIDGTQPSIWHSMQEPTIDTEELEKLFCKAAEGSSTEGVTLFDDLYFRRGRPKQQPVCMFDVDKSQRIKAQLKTITCLLTEFVQVLSTLDSGSLNKDSLAELLDLLSSPRETDKILHYVSRKGAGHLDCPEYLVYELSKVDHFRERLEFLRFKHKLQINLFEIDQQLKELSTACDELTSSTALKNLLGTLLAVGNYLNGGSERGQADGFHIGIVNKLREINDKSGKGNLLEFTLQIYVERYERSTELGCPTRFRLPEPSNMRHAAQVSFEDIRRALSELREELLSVREKVNALSHKENNNLSQGLRVTSENFMTSALEVVFEEEKTLENSKAHFVKTTAYFLHENMQCSPHEFFHIWAEFLHDCKYYWKLAHRNLARHKFEVDFGLKSQMSCSSVPGFNSVRSEMLKHLSAVRDDVEASPMRAQQLKHINNWIESVGKYTQEIKPHKSHHKKDAGKKHEHSSHQRPSSDKKSDHKSVSSQVVRPTSPKPITSTPPNVHKPLALNHASPETVINTAQPLQQQQQQQQQQQHELQHPHQHHSASIRGVVNYENQGQTYETPRQTKAPVGTNEETSKKPARPGHSPENEQKKSPQFSIVSWLKRDQGKKVVDESPSNSVQSHGPVPNTKPSGNPFGKIRTSVVQKFSASSSVKRSQDNRTDTNPQVSKDARSTIHNEREFELIQQSIDKEPPLETSSPLSTLRKEHRRDYQNCYYDHHNPGDQIYSSAPSTLGSTYSKDLTPTKYELSRSVRQRQDSGAKQQYSHSKEVPSDSDRNSITAKTSPQSRGRDRAPIALGSNMSISEAYGKNDPEMHKQNYENDLADPRNVLSNVDTKWVKATAVPVYKAKLIPNYENQMKIDPRLEGQVGIKGKAEPAVLTSHGHHQNSTAASKEYRELLQRKTASHMHQTSTTSQEYREMLQKTSEVYMTGGYQSIQNIQRQTEEQGQMTDSSRRSRSNQKTAATRRSVSAGNLPDRRSEMVLHGEPSHPAPVYPKQLPSSDKMYEAKNMRDRGPGPANAHSINSLIERFEKRPEDEGVGGGMNADYESHFQNNPVSMTSTPVMHRKNQLQTHSLYQHRVDGQVSSPVVPRRSYHQTEVMRGSFQYQSRRQDDVRRPTHQDYESPGDGSKYPDSSRPANSSSTKDSQNYTHQSTHSSQQHHKHQVQQQRQQHQYEQQQQQQYEHHHQKQQQQQHQQLYDIKASNVQNNYSCYESHNYDNMQNDCKPPSSQPLHNQPPPSSSSQYYSGYKSTPPGPPPPKPAHTSLHSSGPALTENYSDQLRKAFAKPNSVFDRHSKPSSHFGHQGSPGAMAVVKPTIIHQGAVEI